MNEVDLVVVNSGPFRPPAPRFVMMHMATERAVSMATGESLPLSRWSGQNVHAVAGLGNPDRFFRHLQDMGMHVMQHPFPDHYRFKTRQLQFKDPWSVLITEKDAVKCRGKPLPRLWYVPASAHLGPGATTLVRELLRRKLPPKPPVP
jgi:tetraacyldisaccharide 4'-kinase